MISYKKKYSYTRISNYCCSALGLQKKNRNLPLLSHSTGPGLNWNKFEVVGLKSLQKNVFWVNPALKHIIV